MKTLFQVLKRLLRLWHATLRTFKYVFSPVGKTAIEAGSLTYSTLMGVVPLIAAMFILLNDPESIKSICSYVAPGLTEIFTRLFNIVASYLHSNHLVLAIGGVISILFSYFLFQSIQRVINDIFGIRHRKFFSKSELVFWIFSIVVILSLICIWSFILKTIEGKFTRYLFSFLLIWLFLVLTFIYTPNTSSKSWIDLGDTAVAATLSSLLLTTIWFSLPLIEKLKDITPENKLFSLLLLSFFMIWLSWFIVLTGVKLYCELANSDREYSKNEAECLAPVYKDYLCGIATSFVINYFKDNGNRGPSLFEIKQRMLSNIVSSRENIQIYHHSDSLIEEIMTRLVNREILWIENGRYIPVEGDYMEMTVSDLYDKLYLSGEWQLDDSQFSLSTDLDRFLRAFLCMQKTHSHQYVCNLITSSGGNNNVLTQRIKEFYKQQAKPIPEEALSYGLLSLNSASDNSDNEYKEAALEYGTPRDFLNKLDHECPVKKPDGLYKV